MLCKMSPSSSPISSKTEPGSISESAKPLVLPFWMFGIARISVRVCDRLATVWSSVSLAGSCSDCHRGLRRWDRTAPHRSQRRRCHQPPVAPLVARPRPGPASHSWEDRARRCLPLWSMINLVRVHLDQLAGVRDHLPEAVNVLLSGAIGDDREGRFARGRRRHADEIEVEVNLLDRRGRGSAAEARY